MERGRPLARGRASAGAAWNPGIPGLVLWLVEEARGSRLKAQGSGLICLKRTKLVRLGCARDAACDGGALSE
jgi:hypothetical protein